MYAWHMLQGCHLFLGNYHIAIFLTLRNFLSSANIPLPSLDSLQIIAVYKFICSIIDCFETKIIDTIDYIEFHSKVFFLF